MNDTTTLAQQMVAAAPATRNVNLRTDSKLMAVVNVWGAMFRGRGAQLILGQKDIRDYVPFLINCDNGI